jgi:hypothetical protein
MRILLLVFMAFVVLLMAGCPGHYDSRRRASASLHYYMAQRQHGSAPCAETRRAVEAARRDLEEAKRVDRRHIMAYEVFLLGILGVSVFALV